MLLSWIVIVVALVGLIVYALGNAKAAEIGRLMFACGLLAACLALAGRWVRLL